MQRKALFFILISLFALNFGLGQAQASNSADLQPLAASPAGTAFTYQGQLIYNDAPVNDTCSFTFSLWDEGGSDPFNGKQIGSDIVLSSVAVVDGLFSVSLDFGAGAFAGDARWLQIWVDCSNISDFLWPRQSLTPAPYSIRSESAADADTLDGEYASAFADTSHAHSPIDIVPQGGNSGLDADFLDGQEASAFAGASHNHDNAYWSLTGNAGTTPGTDFLGTTDGQALELHVNGSRALRLEPDATSPNVVAGHPNNTVLDDAHGSVIGGGGEIGKHNVVYDDYGAIGGGALNQVGSNDGDATTAYYAVVGGGYDNDAGATHATVSGGASNTATAIYATVGGGTNNEATAQWATVGGGAVNTASGNAAIVSGGNYNQAQAQYSVIAGGGPSDEGNPTTTNNVVYDNYGAIGGGGDNRAGSDDSNSTTAEFATVSGGEGNEASAAHATVPGGENNTASGTRSTVGGGFFNAASANYATVAGGDNNEASASFAAVGGGRNNNVQGRFGVIAGGGPWDESNPTTTSNVVYDEYGAIGGGGGNRVGSDDADLSNATYATVSGGGRNVASAVSATVGGGYYNEATGQGSTVSGGESNDANAQWSTVGGGYANNAEALMTTVAGGEMNDIFDQGGTIGGGSFNKAGTDNGVPDSDTYATVGGGYNNIASGSRSTVGGGSSNAASGNYSAVSGGSSNDANGYYTAVAGGRNNTVQGKYGVIAGGGPSDESDLTGTNNVVYDDYGAIGGGGRNQAGTSGTDTTDAKYATVGGGKGNEATAYSTTIGGGNYNDASALYATVGGGDNNRATASYSTVGGGNINVASGDYATVPGGYDNDALGDYSFAAGRRASANDPGCFVWGDTTDAAVTCFTDNRTIFRSSGGFYIYSKGDLSSGVYLSSNGSAWNSVSDRARKENMQAVDTKALLKNLADTEISTWNYKAQDPDIRHIGPMAQDFNALLPELGGEGEKYINTLDADGVALAAIQGLYQLAQGQSSQIETLQQRIADLEALVIASEQTPGTDGDTGAGQ